MARICPDEIVAMFKIEETKAAGRYKAFEWMKTQIAQMGVGDKMLIPDPETGNLMEYEKTERAFYA